MNACEFCTRTEGAGFCTKYGAVKTQRMPRGKALFWRTWFLGFFVMAGMGRDPAVVILPIGAIVMFVYR